MTLSIYQCLIGKDFIKIKRYSFDLVKKLLVHKNAGLLLFFMDIPEIDVLINIRTPKMISLPPKYFTIIMLEPKKYLE